MADAAPATAENTEAAKPAAKPASSSNGKRYAIMIVIGLVAAVVLKLGVFLLFIGMLPAIVAYETDHTKMKFVFTTVATFNFAGVFPDVMQVFMAGGSFEIVKIKLLDPSVWLIMWGSAALGWCMIWLGPTIASSILESIYTGRIIHLEALQKRAEAEWGPEVKGAQPQEPE